MGVVNVTPDSFSDGGRWFDTTAAIKHGLELVAQGADLIDVGGESTRPGATRVDEEEELRRVLPVVRGLAAEGVTLSVDTMRAHVARKAVEAGAALVNDVSGGQADPDMIPTVAATGAPFVVMHWRGFSDNMNSLAVYDDVVTDVVTELRTPASKPSSPAASPRRPRRRPGLGFAKQAHHDLALLARLDALRALGHLLVAASASASSAASSQEAARPRRARASGTPPPPPSPPSPPTKAPGPSARPRRTRGRRRRPRRPRHRARRP